MCTEVNDKRSVKVKKSIMINIREPSLPYHVWIRMSLTLVGIK